MDTSKTEAILYRTGTLTPFPVSFSKFAICVVVIPTNSASFAWVMLSPG